MGLRDWVSEKVHYSSSRLSQPLCFNGAPRLGLGEGSAHTSATVTGRELQWGSETGSRRRYDVTVAPPADFELQWGSETGSRRRRPRPAG